MDSFLDFWLGSYDGLWSWQLLDGYCNSKIGMVAYGWLLHVIYGSKLFCVLFDSSGPFPTVVVGPGPSCRVISAA